jgi:OmpA-OmpF porin, OOP family
VKVVLTLCLLLLTADLFSQKSDTCLYSDGSKSIRLPQGRISFADEVVSFKKGSPSAIPKSSDPHAATGAPDFDGGTFGFVSIGCGGSLVLKFTDNQLIDVEGADLYVFEKGKYLEPTHLEISKDGKSWLDAGNFEGSLSSIDISGHAKPGEFYSYIRLTDLKSECSGSWPGADIDAVAAIGSAQVLSFNSTILFEFSKFTLKEDGKKSLDSLVTQGLKGARIKQIYVEGYTDSIGSEEYNLKLSSFRAKTVADHLSKMLLKQGQTIKIKAIGYGESNPIGPNSSEQGRADNRRVRLLILPGG